MISCSSSIASSAPATSANVVLGVSLVISLARDLPKFMTRDPPPCIWVSRKKKNKAISRYGRNVPSKRLSSVLLFGIWTSYPPLSLPWSNSFCSSCWSCWPWPWIKLAW